MSRASYGVQVRPARVKGENYLLDSLVKIHAEVAMLVGSSFPGLAPIQKSMSDTISYLDRKYVESSGLFGPPINLDLRDAKQLEKDSLTWYESLISTYSSSGSILIDEDRINDLFPESLFEGLDEYTKADFWDGLSAIVHLLPTPGAMILFRVAESVVRKYYENESNKSSEKLKWADIVSELRTNQKTRGVLVGYLDYLRDKRNQAEHPDKRFTQEEAEKILLDVKGLIMELKATH